MLEHISTVAVMDVSNSIRIEVVQKLLNQQDLFSHLAQDRISSRLALGLYDNFRPAQGLFIQLLCNLSHLHHGWVMPALRSLHMNVLVDLQSSCDSATAGKTVAGECESAQRNVYPSVFFSPHSSHASSNRSIGACAVYYPLVKI